MLGAAAHSWKLIVTSALVGVTLLSLSVRPPADPVDPRRLRGFVACGAALYVAGALASLARRSDIAAGIYVVGILMCSAAVWLSRGVRWDDGPGGGDGGTGPSDEGEPPPDPDPDATPTIDWDEFQRALAEYAARINR